MLYALLRAVVAFALRRFYRLEVVSRVADLSGPVMFVGNHPNSLIDPALVFVITDRPVTFLAREPLFRVPVMGFVLRALRALPVYRQQDHPGLMEKNEGTLEAAAQALARGLAITIFPEGKSHSAPQLQALKTGCARIALRVARGGTALRIIPVGLTYEQKHRFRSRVHVEVGEPLLVTAVAGLEPAAEPEWVRGLTQRVQEALRTVTLNLESWEDVGLVETADRLLALRHGFSARDPGRLRVLARAAALLRDEDPERFAELKDDVLSFRARLELLRADDGALSADYDAPRVSRFALRNLARLLLGFPLFVAGLALFAVPFLSLRTLALAAPLSRDRVATLKLVGTLVLVPAWQALLCVAGGLWLGWAGFGVALLGALPLALFTRSFYEQRARTRADAVAFARLGDRARLREHLLHEGERLQDELSRLAEALGPRVAG
jgi:glycerol-3-phosphate O-acyltransferase / dihydroxyacetone phosphate acyltransferase